MIIQLPGAENVFVNTDHIVAITSHSGPLGPKLKSIVALVNGGVLHSSLDPTHLYNQINETIYRRQE